jgi:hypothetical protein
MTNQWSHLFTIDVTKMRVNRGKYKKDDEKEEVTNLLSCPIVNNSKKRCKHRRFQERDWMLIVRDGKADLIKSDGSTIELFKNHQYSTSLHNIGDSGDEGLEKERLLQYEKDAITRAIRNNTCLIRKLAQSEIKEEYPTVAIGNYKKVFHVYVENDQRSVLALSIEPIDSKPIIKFCNSFVIVQTYEDDVHMFYTFDREFDCGYGGSFSMATINNELMTKDLTRELLYSAILKIISLPSVRFNLIAENWEIQDNRPDEVACASLNRLFARIFMGYVHGLEGTKITHSDCTESYFFTIFFPSKNRSVQPLCLKIPRPTGYTGDADISNIMEIEKMIYEIWKYVSEN